MATRFPPETGIGRRGVPAPAGGTGSTGHLPPLQAGGIREDSGFGPSKPAAMHPEMAEGVRLFAEAKWWHAHEAWEQVWLQRPDTPEGRSCRALIQLAAALVQTRRRNARGALGLLERALPHLPPGFAATAERLDHVLRQGRIPDLVLAAAPGLAQGVLPE